MTKADDTTIGDAKDITLHYVIVHMQHMEQRLSAKTDDTERRLSLKIAGVKNGLSAKIDANTHAIQDLTLRIDALEEDLTATIKDTIKIRRHVGMVSVDEE